MIIEDDIQLAREVWVAPDAPGSIVGDGSKSSPYRTIDGLLDPLWPMLGESVKVHFLAGQYKTNGLRAPKEFIGIGEGMDATHIRSVDNARLNFPAVRMISDNADGQQWSKLFVLRDLTLDGNWQGQSEAATNGNFRVEPLVVQTIRGKVHRVRVVNFGANGAAWGNLGHETFPLFLVTFSNGAPFNYYPVFSALKETEPQTYIEISKCEVLQPHFLNGGYCTGIDWRTNFPDGTGDRQPFGERSTVVAVIRDNYVNVPGGIAYGAAHAEMSLFEGNVAADSKCGFNADTGTYGRITIRNNQFLRCNQGINITPAAAKDFDIARNTFVLSEPFYNPVLKIHEEFYGIKVRWSERIFARENYFLGPAGCKFLDIENGPSDRFSNRFTLLGGESGTRIQEAEARLRAAEEERDRLMDLLEAERSTSAKFRGRLDAAEQVIGQVRAIVK